MWQRLTERAQRAIHAATSEAQEAGADMVDTEHLLLGILSDLENSGVRILRAVGIEPEGLRKIVEARMPRGKRGTGKASTCSPGGKLAIELAYHEARDLGDNYIGTEHLILGLLKERRGLAA